MKRNDPMIERLGAIPTFTRCSRRELTVLARTLIEEHIEPGDVVMREGTVGRTFLVIASGSARVQIGERTIAGLGPGDVVGEIALLDQSPRTATVTAETAVIAYGCTRQEFAHLLVAVPSLAHVVLHTLAERLRAADHDLAGSAIDAGGR